VFKNGGKKLKALDENFKPRRKKGEKRK
jgi:hypothetical protein